MIFLRDITEAKVETHGICRWQRIMLHGAADSSIVRLVDRFVVCDLENDRYRFYNLNGQIIYKPLGFLS